MARLLFGDKITDMRGSVGGVTYSRNAFGSYIKLKRAPPRTPNELQSKRRSVFGYVAAYWTSDLTSGERAGWETYADATIFYDSLGNYYYASGFNMFIRTNTLRMVTGQDILDAAPGTSGHGTALTIDSGEITVDASDNTYSIGEFTFTNWLKSTTDDIVAIYGIPQIASTGTTKRAPQRYLGEIVGNAGSPPGFPKVIPYPFGQLYAGNIAVIKFRRIEPNGKISSFTAVNIAIQA